MYAADEGASADAGAGDERPSPTLSPPPRPHPDYIENLRKRIHIGWEASAVDSDRRTDTAIGAYSQRVGKDLYNFVSYPIGGAERAAWPPAKDSCPPPIHLPDVQLKNQLWEQYVVGHPSGWIDCDSEEEWLAALSERELDRELSYAVYLGLRVVCIHLKRTHSPRLTAILSRGLWTRNNHMAFWVFVPTEVGQLLKKESEPVVDAWEVWAGVRAGCANYSSSRLELGLRLTANMDDEFMEEKLVDRWMAEPLMAFLVDTDIFQTDAMGKAMLSQAHVTLLRNLWLPEDVQRVLCRGEAPPSGAGRFAAALRAAVGCVRPMDESVRPRNFLDSANIHYMDVLQAPLQPLAENLDSGVYNTFEQDEIKYIKYGEAMEAAIRDICTKEPAIDLVLYVLGAGRGPLVSAAIAAERRFNDAHRTRHDRLRMRIVVVEKNQNAIVTLRHCNEKLWQSRCVLVESDMRCLPGVAAEMALPRPDLIVSELLGSWGDNELSPECLDGVTAVLKKEKTICIPASYTSFCAPVMSLLTHQTIAAGGATHWQKGVPGNGRALTQRQPDGSWKHEHPHGQAQASRDHVYVAYLRQFCALGEPASIFTFDHPNWHGASNERVVDVPWQMDRTADVMGFAGYFTTRLYKEVVLSTVPSTHTPNMLSWFPAVIPLRELLRVKEGDKLTLHVERKMDEGGVWYEWNASLQKSDGQTITTQMQNENGASYYMRLL